MKDQPTDDATIKAGEAAACHICAHVFKRIRFTWRYCNECHKAFCEGEHGTFEGGKVGVCVRCYNVPD
jgi:hypothetical protein